MPQQFQTNDYLKDLLALQQDGKQAISAPTNWVTQEPLLQVPTEIDAIINDLAKAILRGETGNTIGTWHFFIGSPGNGKSAAMGKLCKELIGKGCRIQDESGCLIQELAEDDVPYALDVYEADNKFPSARIVQDASVVRNPFSSELDPASELISTMRESWGKGISLIVCTNRGVLEKAHSDCHTDRAVNTEDWFHTLYSFASAETVTYKQVPDDRDFSGRKTVFDKVQLSYSCLDNRSLLIGSDIFLQLVEKAVDVSHWETCNSCQSDDLCPFKANRDWLADIEARDKCLLLLRRAEALSGQIVVFREALALISFILSGCPRDYADGHPCKWVEGKISNGDVFSLATRRIYMSLFASFSNLGMEYPDVIRKIQSKALRDLADSIAEGEELRSLLNHALNSPVPSSDVGVTRLLGEGGILSQIDPLGDPLPIDFYDSWDADFDTILNHGNSLITQIERRCAEIWGSLEEVIESTADYSTFESQRALRRWSSNFFLHLGALLEGRTAWGNELDEFISLIELMEQDRSNWTGDDQRQVFELKKRISELFYTASDRRIDPEAVQLSETVSLSGRWVREKLQPQPDAGKKPGNLGLEVTFKGGERATLGAQMFLWLSKSEHGKLDPRCFPMGLLTGAMDARVRAAAKGKYAFEDNGVELFITANKNEIFKLIRFDGGVINEPGIS